MTDTAARRGGAAAATRRVEALRRDAVTCRDCDLYARATQTVFGEGPGDAKLILMGEQPGDREDRAGRPFVGPAGRLLDEALEEAGIDRGDVYVTNAVKHFKWRPAGKIRLHQKPNARQVAACRQWWEREVEAVAPDVLCCLGATAAQAVLGSTYRVSRQRGTFVRLASGVLVTATVHPSSILRADDDTRASERARFVEDLRAVAAHLR